MSGKVMKYLFGGISWGCVVSCIVNVIGTITQGAVKRGNQHVVAGKLGQQQHLSAGAAELLPDAARDAGTHPLCDRIRSICPDCICDGLDPRRYFNWRDLFGNASDGSDVICDLDLFLRSLSQRGKADQ